MGETKDAALFRQAVRKHFPNDRIDRVEGIFAEGMPDTNWCIDGRDHWLENKSPVEPVKPSSKLFANNHSVLRSQMNWALRQRNAGGCSWFFIATNKRWMLVDGKHADRLNDMTADEINHIATWCDHPLGKADKDKWLDLRWGVINGSK